MPLPIYLAADFLAAFQRLLPRGRVWPREPDAVQTRALAPLFPTWERLAGRDANLVADGYPLTAVELLPEWEATLGLPDPCLGPSPSIAQRQAQVRARIGATGGAAEAQFIAFAAALGFTITITGFEVARCGACACGDPDYGDAWTFAWNVHCDPAAVPILSCEFARMKPAHTYLLFNYSE